MSLQHNPSKRARFSREGFSPIPGGNQANNMAPNDATIDIPLEQVNTRYDGATSDGILQSTTSRESASKRKPMFHGRRRKAAEVGTGNMGYDGEEDRVTAMGKVYRKVLNFSVLTRYLLYIVPVGLCIAVPIIVGATVAEKARLADVKLFWFFTWVEIVWASLWVSKIVAHYLPYVFQVFAGVVSSGVRKYSEVIRTLEIPLSLVGWAVASLATFKPIMIISAKKDDSGDYPEWITIMQRVLGAAVASSLVFLGEKAIIQLLSIDYHRKQFNFRIKESKHNVYLLSQLYDASRTLFPSYCNEFAEEDYIIADQLDLKALGLGSKGHGHNRSGSVTPGRLLADLGRYGDKLTSAFGNVAHEITGREILNPNSAHSIVVTALEKKKSSEALAKRIWMSFVVEGHEALFQEDLMDVLGDARRTEAEEAFAAIDRDGNGDISLDEMIMVVTEFGRERKAIATSMHDVDQAINVLDNLLGAAVFVAVVFIFIAFLNKSFVTTLATAGTALLSLSFVFSVTCQEVLGSCIFVFVKHPFDVSDRIDLGEDQFIVEHISLLFTVFKRASGANCGRVVQIPNIVLNSLWVENISRSKAMTEQFDISVSFDTSFDDIQILKDELEKFVRDKDNSRDFLPDIEIGILGTTDQSKLMLQVEIRHKSNWANETIRQARRSKFMCALIAALKAVPIYAPGGGGDPQGSAANPNYGVNITRSEAKESADETSQKRAESRLVSKNKLEEAKKNMSPTVGAAGLTSNDNRIIDDLTSRDPTADPTRDATWAGRRDSSTLGERPSIDQHDLDDVRNVLRRGNTRGKRKPSSEASRLQAPSVPTINEPQQGYENYRPGVYNTSSNTNARPGVSDYQSPLPQMYPTSPLEMSQVGRSNSNPYRRSQAEGPARAQMASTEEEEEEEERDLRPYSGV